jgi:hypothetical protein
MCLPHVSDERDPLQTVEDLQSRSQSCRVRHNLDIVGSAVWLRRTERVSVLAGRLNSSDHMIGTLTLTRRSLQFRQPKRDLVWGFRLRDTAAIGVESIAVRSLHSTDVEVDVSTMDCS